MVRVKKYFLVIVLIGLGISSNASIPTKSKVLEPLKESADTQKINTLINFSRTNYLSDYNKSLEAVQEALKMSVQSNYHIGRAFSLYEIANIYASKNNTDTSISFYNQSVRIFSQLDDKANIANCYDKIGLVYASNGNYKEALFYFYEALELYTATNKKQGIYEALNNIGAIYRVQGNYNKALEYQNKALQLSRELKNARGTSSILGNMGLIYFEVGDYKKAAEYYENSQKIAVAIGDKKQIAAMYNNLGLLKQSNGEYDQAIALYLKSVNIYRELNDHQSAYSSLNKIGEVHELKKEYDMASNYYLRCMNIASEIGYNKGISESYLHIGLMYSRQKKDEKALLYYNKALDVAKQKNEPGQITLSYLRIGDLYSGKAKYDDAFSYYDKAYKIALEKKNNLLLKEYFQSMTNTYSLRSDFKNAYDYSLKLAAIKDTINNEQNSMRFSQLQIGFDFDNKETEIALLKKNNEIKNLEIDKQEFAKYILILIIAIVAISLFLVYNRYLYIRKSNKLLKVQKEEIAIANECLSKLNETLVEQKQKVEILNTELQTSNEKLVLSEKTLLELNATKDKLFSIISHDLRNPFASIISFSRLMKRDFDQFTKEELHNLVDELDKSVSVINNLLENVLQWSRHQTGRTQYKPEYINPAEIINDNIMSVIQNVKEKNLVIRNEVNESLEVWADKQLTDAIIRNLLSNAIKFSKNGNPIVFTSLLNHNFATFSVVDTGIGITEENLKNIYNIEDRKVTFGTNDEKGSGLGLILCKALTEVQGGEIKVESDIEKGTSISFSLPISEAD